MKSRRSALLSIALRMSEGGRLLYLPPLMCFEPLVRSASHEVALEPDACCIAVGELNYFTVSVLTVLPTSRHRRFPRR